MSGGLLESLRVLDLGGAESDLVSRLFADLGADVLKIEPPAGSPARHALPNVAGASIPFALHNANKRSAVLDPDSSADRDRLIELAGAPTSWWTAAIPGGRRSGRRARRLPSGSATWLRCRSPISGRLVHTLHGTLPIRCCTPCRRRCRVPGRRRERRCCRREGIASATAAVQAAWAALAAYYHRLRCGTGEYIDFSRFEAVVQSLDPPFGSEGQAAVGLKRSGELWRGRPRNQQIYPIFPCTDGYVRICLLSPRQWRGMRAWLGEPEQLRRPEVRHHRGPLRGVTRTQRGHRRAVRRADDGRPGGRGPASRGADRRGAHARAERWRRSISVPSAH